MPDLLARLASVLEHRGKNEAAQKLWTESAKIYEDLAQPVAADDRQSDRQMQYYQSLQAIYQQLNLWDEAIRVTQLLLDQRKQTMLPDDPNLWRVKTALGAFYGKRDERDGTQTAKPLLMEAAEYWRGRVPPAPIDLVRTLNNLADVARNSGGYAEALQYLDEAIPICRGIYTENDVRLAEVYGNQAAVLSAQGRYKAAIDLYGQAIDICRREPDARRKNELLATTLVNTAMLYKSQRQFGNAATFCFDALEVQRTSGDEASGLVPFYTALASLYIAKEQAHPTGPAATSDDLDKAANFTHQARDLCQKYDLLEQWEGILVRQLEATIHLRKGELDASEAAFEEALTLAQQRKEPALAAKSLTYLAEIELRRGKFQRADELAGEAIKSTNRCKPIQTCDSWPIWPPRGRSMNWGSVTKPSTRWGGQSI